MARDECDNERSAKAYKLFSRIIGFLAGMGPAISGLGICVVSYGVGCVPGTIMMLHGLNNIYENGYYLLFHEGNQDGSEMHINMVLKHLGQIRIMLISLIVRWVLRCLVMDSFVVYPPSGKVIEFIWNDITSNRLYSRHKRYEWSCIYT